MRKWLSMTALAGVLFLSACAVEQGTTTEGERTLEVRRATESETRAEVREETTQAAQATETVVTEAGAQANNQDVRTEAERSLADARRKRAILAANEQTSERDQMMAQLDERINKLEKSLADYKAVAPEALAASGHDLKEYGKVAPEALAASALDVKEGVADLTNYLSQINVDLHPGDND